MSKFCIFFICLYHLLPSAVYAYSSLDNNNGGCDKNDDGSWTRYLDEKCIKIYDKLVTFEEAETKCRGDYYYYYDEEYYNQYEYKYEARVVTINSAEEQEFLVNFLFNQKEISDSVWLGAQFNPNVTENWEWHRAGGQTDQWTYSNWRKDYPKGLPSIGNETLLGGNNLESSNNNKTCVQMIGGVEEARGEWINEPCSKNNRVVCERRQIWKDIKIQELLEKVARHQNVLMTEHEDLKKKVDELVKNATQPDNATQFQQGDNPNSVPVGFVYVQLPGELTPMEIFSANPTYVWKEISQDFAGVFFRVAGSRAARFGAVQEQSMPYLDAVKRNWCEVGSNGACNHLDAYGGKFANAKSDIQLQAPSKVGDSSENWSDPLWTVNKYVANSTGQAGPFYGEYLTFHTTGGEVRPKNMAVRIWKRTV